MVAVKSILLIVLLGICCGEQDHYVHSVHCDATQMTVEMSSASSLVQHTNSLYAVYSLGTECDLLKLVTPFDSNANVFSINYVKCNVSFDDLYGDRGEVIGYHTTQYFRAQALNLTSLDMDTGDFSPPKGHSRNYTFHAYCFIPTTVKTATQYNITGSSDTDDPDSKSGSNINPTKHIQMNLTDQNNQPLESGGVVYTGDDLRVTISIPKSDDTYNATVPMDCYFSSDKNRPESGLPIIQDSCPNSDLIEQFPQIVKVVKVDKKTYYVDFKAFLFGNPTHGKLVLTCNLMLCLEAARCEKECWPLDDLNQLTFYQSFAVVKPKTEKESAQEMLKARHQVALTVLPSYMDVNGGKSGNQPYVINQTYPVYWLLIIGGVVLFVFVVLFIGLLVVVKHSNKTTVVPVYAGGVQGPAAQLREQEVQVGGSELPAEPLRELSIPRAWVPDQK